MLGGGPLHAEALAQLQAAGAADQAWLPGDRSDVAQLLPQFDLFVLPSQAEGISNTLLEAMASGCAPVATAGAGMASWLKTASTARARARAGQRGAGWRPRGLGARPSAPPGAG